eukprot:5445245-Prymnesium_polylepis.2
MECDEQPASAAPRVAAAAAATLRMPKRRPQRQFLRRQRPPGRGRRPGHRPCPKWRRHGLQQSISGSTPAVTIAAV